MNISFNSRLLDFYVGIADRRFDYQDMILAGWRLRWRKKRRGFWIRLERGSGYATVTLHREKDLKRIGWRIQGPLVRIR